MKITKKKGILFIGIVLLIILGFFAGIFFSPKTDVKRYTFSPTPTVVPTPLIYRKLLSPDEKTHSWKTFADDGLKYSIKYPDDVVIDKRQTVEGKITAFIFEEDKTASLSGKVTTLYVADTHKSGVDGFTAFSRGDCGSDCNVLYKKADWVMINNVYGIRNPLPNNIHNYYLTDKKQSGSVVNVYIGGYVKDTAKVEEKILVFDEMIKTFTFNR
jgi:hypothetical protein